MRITAIRCAARPAGTTRALFPFLGLAMAVRFAAADEDAPKPAVVMGKLVSRKAEDGGTEYRVAGTWKSGSLGSGTFRVEFGAEAE